MVAATPASAQAGENDIVLSRLGNVTGGGMNVVGDNVMFRSMVSELGVVLAPRLLAPADTLGFGGFQFSADVGFTSITNDAAYWRVLESSNQPTGTDVSHGNGTMRTVGMFVRKGFWLPLPSFEIGAGAVHLTGSRLWTAQGYAKFALHEGYHDYPLPSLAVRAGVSRMMGASDLDLTIASVDVSISKTIGVGGSVAFEPFAGWDFLIIVPRSEVIDKTPNIGDDPSMNFVFKDQDDIMRNKIFFGTKIQYYVFEVTLEASFALKGSSIDDRNGTDMACVAGSTTTSCDSTDQAKMQSTYIMSLGLDF